MRRKHIITLLFACFATLSTWAGDVLTFRPITDVSQLKSGARVVLVGDYTVGTQHKYAIATFGEYDESTKRSAKFVNLEADGSLKIDRDDCTYTVPSYATQTIFYKEESEKANPLLLQLYQTQTTTASNGYFLQLHNPSDFRNYYLAGFGYRTGVGIDIWQNSCLPLTQPEYTNAWNFSFNPAVDFIDGKADVEGKTASGLVMRFGMQDRNNNYEMAYTYVRFALDAEGVPYFRGDKVESMLEGSVIKPHVSLFIEDCQHLTADLEKVTGNAATCTLVGQSDVYKCLGCNRYFTDEACTHECGELGERTSALGHDFSSGNTCSRCGAAYERHHYNGPSGSIHNIDFSTGSHIFYGSVLEENGVDEYGTPTYTEVFYAMTTEPMPDGSGYKAKRLDLDASYRPFVSNDEVLFATFDNTKRTLKIGDNLLGIRDGKLLLVNPDIDYPWLYNYLGTYIQKFAYYDSWEYATNMKVVIQDGMFYDKKYGVALLTNAHGENYFGVVPEESYPVAARYLGILAQDCEHEHKTFYPGHEATCTTEGMPDYYICNDCDNYLDENDRYSYPEPINPLGHNYVDGFCTRCGQPALSYRLVTDPKQISAGRKYILVAKVDEGKSEQYYVMGEIGGKTPYGRGAAVPVTPNPDGTIASSGKFSEIDIVEVPRGSVYNVKQEPLYYFVINGHSIRSYKGFDLGGMPIDPDRDLIEQFKELGYINGLQEFEGDNNYIQSGAVLTYINGMDWKGPQSFANIKSLEPYSAVIYPKGVFEDPEHCFGFVNDGKETFFCSWYDSNPNTALPNVPIYLYVSTDDVVSYNKEMGTLYVEQDEPVTVEVIVDAAIKAQEKTSAPLTSIDLSATMLTYDFDINMLKDAIFSSKDLDVSENALIILPDSYAPGKDEKGDKKAKGDKGDEMTNVIVAGHSNRIELVDAQNLAVATDFSTDEFEYTKTLTTGRWSTLVLPAAVEVPAGIEAMELTSVDLDNLTITFTPVSTLTPNVPVIVRKTTEGDEPTAFSAFGVDVKATTGQVADIQFQGTYTGLGAGEAAALGYHILAPDNAFHPAGEKATIAPFRAFLTVSESGDKGGDKGDGIKKSNLRIVFDTPTGLFTLGQQKLLQIALLPGAVTLRGEAGREVTIVDATGRLVKSLRLAAEETTVSLPAGVYVVNGTKVSVK